MSAHAFRWTLAVVIASCLCGCLPKRVFWSPDGQKAAIVANDGLRLCTAEGKLSEVVSESIGAVEWLPDGRGFVAIENHAARTWKEASAVLKPERREVLIKLAEPLREEVLAYDGAWEDFKPHSVLGQATNGELAALLMYLREERSEGLREKLGDRWEDLADAEALIARLRLYEVSELKVIPGRILYQALAQIADSMRLSPDGRALAFVHGSPDPEGVSSSSLQLSLLSMAGGDPRPVADDVAAYPDWSLDGESLVYAKAANHLSGEQDIGLGSLYAQRVRDEAAGLKQTFLEPEVKSHVLFWRDMKTRSLRDGGILFAAMSITLPATSEQDPKMNLFTVDRAGQVHLQEFETPDSDAKDFLRMGQLWELSSDGQRVLISGAKNVAAHVLTLSTGEIREVLNTDTEARGVAGWRTAEELSLIVPPGCPLGSKERYELVLWSAPDKTRCLSCEWPDLFAEQKPGP